MLYEFFDCSTNIPRGLSAYNPNIIYIFSQDVYIHDIVFSVCKMFLRLQIIEINKICKPKGNNCLCEPNGIALREEKF